MTAYSEKLSRISAMLDKITVGLKSLALNQSGHVVPAQMLQHNPAHQPLDYSLKLQLLKAKIQKKANKNNLEVLLFSEETLALHLDDSLIFPPGSPKQQKYEPEFLTENHGDASNQSSFLEQTKNSPVRQGHDFTNDSAFKHALDCSQKKSSEPIIPSPLRFPSQKNPKELRLTSHKKIKNLMLRLNLSQEELASLKDKPRRSSMFAVQTKASPLRKSRDFGNHMPTKNGKRNIFPTIHTSQTSGSAFLTNSFLRANTERPTREKSVPFAPYSGSIFGQ